MVYLKKKAKVPGIDLVTDDYDMKLVKSFNEELADTNKWERFKMTGDAQGAYGRYGYWIDSNGIRHECLVEIYSFQTAGAKKGIIYNSVLLIHELNDSKTTVLNSFVMDGGNCFPFIVKNDISTKLFASNGETIYFD